MQVSVVDVNAYLSLILMDIRQVENIKPTYILKNAVMLNSVCTTFLTLIYTHH